LSWRVATALSTHVLGHLLDQLIDHDNPAKQENTWQ
jgi:hypothetical protein